MTFPHCKRPCRECPWRVDSQPGKFSRDRYRDLAETACDLATRVFACHMTEGEKTTACAGFLLSLDAHHNLTLRLAQSRGALDLREVSTETPLFPNYYRLARANGVPARDPALSILRRDCR